MLVEKTQAEYESKHNVPVNITVWHSDVEMEENFDSILDSGECEFKSGDGYRVVVFRGAGFSENRGERGFDHWSCAGNQSIDGNKVTYKPR
jgi:hypothetical protein